MSELSSVEKAKIAAEAAVDLKATDPVAIDVHDLVSFTNVFVILTGRSDRQVRAIADAVAKALAQRGEKPFGIEGLEDGRWVLMDLSDVIVHVFQDEVRTQYDLERLWSDAPRLDLGLPPSEALQNSAH